MIIESSPTNLDPRVGIDAQSARIDEMIFDSLVRKDEHFELKPWLAESWEIPDPQTYVFHLRKGVRFHNGQPLTSRDVKWTLDSLLTGKIRSSKTATYNKIDHIDAPDDYTVIDSPEGADGVAAVEPVRRRDWDRALRQRRRVQQESHRLGAVPLRQRAAGQRSRSSNATRIIGRHQPNCSAWNSK